MPEDQVPAAAPAQAGPTDFETWAKLPEEEKNAQPAAEPAKAAAAETAKPQAADPDAADPDAATDPEVPKGLQKRFRELTTKIRNLEAAAAAKPAAETPAKGEPAKPEPARAPATVAATAAKPKAGDFDTYEEFIEKLTDWNIDQRDAQRAQRQQQQEQSRAATERGNAWQAELAAARERYDDFDTVALSDMPINRATHNAIVEGGKDGTELAYWLGQNREEAARIFKLSPVQTTLALGKILAKISTDDAAPAPAPVTRAPRPVKPVGAGAGEALGKEPDPSDYPKWSKWNAKREALAAD